MKDASILLTPSDRIESCLSQLAAFARMGPSTHRMATCAMTHFSLIAIHPFFDGNGRVARATLPPQLRYFRIVDAPILFASEILLREASGYFRRAESTERHGELTAWVRFFAEILTQQAILSSSFLKTVARIHRDIACTLHERGVERKTSERFAGDVLLSPSFSLSQAAQRC
jgi:Fic family protein